MGSEWFTPAIRIAHPDQHIRLDQLGEWSIVFLDLDEFSGASLDDKAEHVLKWVIDQRSRAEGSNPIISSIITLGASELKSEKAIEMLRYAGVIFHPKPDGYDDATTEAKKVALLQEWMQEIHKGVAPLDAPDLTSTLPLTGTHEVEDLSIYFDPPYPVSNEDYERLIKCLQTSDDDWEEED
jgi:hypothetical protein